jgi:hypothetical protein
MHDFEHFSESEWEDRGELSWNEFDWQQYLKQNEKEIARFLTLYLQFKGRPDHLDEVARLMGWGDQDWAPGKDEPTQALAESGPGGDPSAAASGPTLDAPSPESEDDDFEDLPNTYTIHKHPVFIATRGLNQHLNHVWEVFIANGNDLGVNTGLAWKFAASIHAGELNSVMAIHALDLGDFTLTICHLKNALNAVNHSLSLLHALPLGGNSTHSQFFREVQATLFDLREIWLRVMSDCRVENNHRAADGADDRD